MMVTFYNEAGEKLGTAYSAAGDTCAKSRDKEEHKPHPFHPEFALYGPYMCAGWPKIRLYNQPKRESIN